MALFRLNIEWSDSSKNTLVYKYPFKKSGREVNNKSTLTVRESQCAVFVYKGQVADVFGPGLYDLKTEIFPILTKLAATKTGDTLCQQFAQVAIVTGQTVDNCLRYAGQIALQFALVFKFVFVHGESFPRCTAPLLCNFLS